MVEEAYAHVQGESLKAYAALLTEAYQLPDRQLGECMRLFIGLTLLIASLISALGIPHAVSLLRKNWPQRLRIFPVVMHIAMTAWFLTAGLWSLLPALGAVMVLLACCGLVLAALTLEHFGRTL